MVWIPFQTSVTYSCNFSPLLLNGSFLFLKIILIFSSGLFLNISTLAQSNKNRIRVDFNYFSVFAQYTNPLSLLTATKKSFTKIIEGELIIFWRQSEQRLALKRGIKAFFSGWCSHKKMHIIICCMEASPMLQVTSHNLSGECNWLNMCFF